jgi:hypothetical protein
MPAIRIYPWASDLRRLTPDWALALPSMAKGAKSTSVLVLLVLALAAVVIIPLALTSRQTPSPSTVTSENSGGNTTTAYSTAARATNTSTVESEPVVSTTATTVSTSSGYQMSIETDRSAYAIGGVIIIGGSVTPPPPGASNATITVTSPQGVVAIATSAVSTTNGSYSYHLATGGNDNNWVSGTYTARGDWTAFGQTETAMTHFEFENVFRP